MQGPRGCLCPGSEPAGLSDRFDFGGCLTSFRHPFFIRTAIREPFRMRCAQRVKDVSGNPCACVCGGGYPVSCRRLFVRPGAGRLERRPDRSNGGSADRGASRPNRAAGCGTMSGGCPRLRCGMRDRVAERPCPDGMAGSGNGNSRASEGGLRSRMRGESGLRGKGRHGTLWSRRSDCRIGGVSGWG